MQCEYPDGLENLIYSQGIRELDCNLKNKRSYNFFLVDRRVFQNLFLERSKV